MKQLILSFLFIPLGLLLQAQGISDTKFGNGMINFIAKDSSFSVKFAPRVQSRYQSEWSYDGEDYDPADINFSVRRARLKFGGFAFLPKLKYSYFLSFTPEFPSKAIGSNLDVMGL